MTRSLIEDAEGVAHWLANVFRRLATLFRRKAAPSPAAAPLAASTPPAATVAPLIVAGDPALTLTLPKA